jgi:hypothetical protein
MELTDLTHKLSKQLDELRDRTADAVGADGGSVFRELGKLSKQLGRSRTTSTTASRTSPTSSTSTGRRCTRASAAPRGRGACSG